MTIVRLLRYLGSVAVVALLLHLLVAFAAASAMQRLYPHRVFNARTWSGSGVERFHLLGSFLIENSRPTSAPLIAVIGSSVSYGFPWADRFIFSSLLAERRPEARVINASLVAADVVGVNNFVVCAAFRNHVKFDIAIVEIPVVNTTAQLVSYFKRRLASEPLAPCVEGAADPGYLQLAVSRPRGIGWIRFLWNSESHETQEAALTLGRVPKDYFAKASDFEDIRLDYESRIAVLLRNAQQVSNVVYAYPSPIYVGGLDEIGEDATAVREQLEASERACASVSGVRCLQTSSLWTNRSYFYNLTHLSQTGHRAFADLLDAAVVINQAAVAP